MTGQLMDDPNRQAVGLDPAWVEGTGGSDNVAAPTKRKPGRPPKSATDAPEPAPDDDDGDEG